MIDHYKMFAAYNNWANRTVYQAAADLRPEQLDADSGVFFGSVIGTLNHLLVTDRIWLKRFTGSGEAPDTLDARLFDDLASLAAARETEDQRIISWIDSLSEAQIAAPFHYRSISKPIPVTQKLGPALAHLFNHQTHHRGHVHASLTGFGKPSICLDMIYFQRQPEGIAWA